MLHFLLAPTMRDIHEKNPASIAWKITEIPRTQGDEKQQQFSVLLRYNHPRVFSDASLLANHPEVSRSVQSQRLKQSGPLQ